MVTAAALIAQQVAGKAVRDALFLSSYNVKVLPPVMIGAALLGIAAVLAFSRALTALSPARAVPWAVGASSVLLLGEWYLSLTAPRVAAVAVYLHMAVFGATLVSGFWSLVSERFDPHTAKRVVGPIGTGASIGGVAGGALAFGAAEVVQVPTMLALMAGVNALCVLGLRRLRPPRRPHSRPQRAPEAAGQPGGPLSGLRILNEVPYLRDLALVVGLGALVEALLDYALNARAVEVYQGGPALMSFFALYHTGVGVLALVLQSAFGSRSLRSIGLAGTVALQPVVVAIGSLLALASPRLLGVALVRGAEAVLHNSLFRSGYEVFYTPLPRDKKRPTKAIVDVGFDRVGTMTGAFLTLLVVAALPSISIQALFLLAAAAAIAALLITRRLHLGYVAAL
jgi:ATP/ADP translocase